MNNLAKIYVLKDPTTNEIRYVGKTIKPLIKRLYSHLADEQRNHRVMWITKLKSQNLRPIIEQIDIVPEGQWAEAEKKWIKHYNDLGYNLVNGDEGGIGCVGYKHTKETKEKLRILNLGHTRSIQNSDKIRKSLIKYYEDPAAREAISKVHKNKIISDEHKRIVGLATKRRWELFRVVKAYNQFTYEI